MSLALFLAALAPFVASPQDDALPEILPLRERAELMDSWLLKRLETVVPAIMREQRVDMWIIVAREYNEDPVVTTMLPATWMAARRRTILVFQDPTPLKRDKPLELTRLAVSRYDIGEFFDSAWDPAKEPDQWECLATIVAGARPRRIAVNISDDFALGDGLSSSQHMSLLQALPARYQVAGGVTTRHQLPIRWLETRIPEEMEVYPSLCRIAHRIIAEGFQEVVPDRTTTVDLEWWYRERIVELDLDTWFHPSVSLQRRQEGHSGSFAAKSGSMIVKKGDLLHVDFGITYLGLNTDTQQHAYVLGPGETQVPAGLQSAMQVGNRLQDILMGEFKVGRSGNQILKRALAQATEEGIEATIYTHPLGFHGHGAGPTIGLWDQQDGVPGRGDYPLYANTAHSIELNVAVHLDEWDDQKIRIMLEEDAFFEGESCQFLDGRQTTFHLIR